MAREPGHAGGLPLEAMLLGKARRRDVLVLVAHERQRGGSLPRAEADVPQSRDSPPGAASEPLRDDCQAAQRMGEAAGRE